MRLGFFCRGLGAQNLDPGRMGKFLAAVITHSGSLPLVSDCSSFRCSEQAGLPDRIGLVSELNASASPGKPPAIMLGCEDGQKPAF